MKKHCCSLLVVLLSCLLASCGDDDYRYPSVKQDFLTAFSGTDGRLESVLTDEGERLRIVEGASGLRVSADTAVRIVANYETLAIGDITLGRSIIHPRSMSEPSSSDTARATPSYFQFAKSSDE